MKRIAVIKGQRGVTLVVGMVMLVVVTLMVTSGFLLSTTSLKAVANLQFRDQAVVAANVAIEDALSSLLADGSTVYPPRQTIPVDLNNDGTADYPVLVLDPQDPDDANRGAVCLSATELPPAASEPGSGSSVTLVLPGGPANPYSTLWEIVAQVTDAATGAAVSVRQGVRVQLTKDQKDAVCP